MTWNNDHNKRAVAILRISSKRQEGNSSHEVQEGEVRAYCLRNELKLIDVRRIVESAKNSEKRKHYSSAISWALEQGIRHIIFYMFDRESRNLTDNEKNETLVKQDRIVIHYVRDSKVIFKGSSDSDFFMRDIQAATNKQFIRNLSAKVMDAMTQKAKSGWFPNNHVPLGYIHQKNKDENGRELKRGTTICPDPITKNVSQVRREFELRANGFSYDAIRSKIITEGFIPSEQVPHYRKGTIEKRLKNPFYYGRFRWQGTEYDGKHELIIDDEILKRVKDSFVIRGKNLNQKHGEIPRGLLKCGEPTCNCMIVYDPKEKILKSNGMTKTYHYYRCSNSKRVHKTMTGMHILETKLWEQLEKSTNDVAIEQSFAEAIYDGLEKLYEKNRELKKSEINGFRNGLSELESAEDKIYDNFVNAYESAALTI